MDGRSVQLIGGNEKAIDAGDPIAIAKRFAPIGEIAVIDLDAATGRGSNSELIREILAHARCRVGGGIRNVDTALDWLDAGATKVILGTSAKPEILRQLPRDRTIAALDAEDGEVVVEGWQKKTGRQVETCIDEIRAFVGGFLITFVEREGRLCGIDFARCKHLRQAAGDTKITFAGGITTAAEIAALDQLGADAQVGMAIYTGALELSEAFAAPLSSDRTDGLWPTVVVDNRGYALGLAWSNRESLRAAIERRRGIYRSRTHGLWVKGATSGAEQKLLRVDLDCDRDAIRFTVNQQASGFCHQDTWTCWGEANGLGALERKLNHIAKHGDERSYTRRLLANPTLLQSKLLEEAEELARAQTREEVIHEAADLAYFTSVAANRSNISWAEIECELDRRSRRIRRSGGDEKGTIND